MCVCKMFYKWQQHANIYSRLHFGFLLNSDTTSNTTPCRNKTLFTGLFGSRLIFHYSFFCFFSTIFPSLTYFVHSWAPDFLVFWQSMLYLCLITGFWILLGLILYILFYSSALICSLPKLSNTMCSHKEMQPTHAHFLFLIVIESENIFYY